MHETGSGSALKGGERYPATAQNSTSKPLGHKTLQSVSIKSFTHPGSVAAKQTAGKMERNILRDDNGIDLSWDNQFTPEQLQEVWNEYARSVEKTNPRLFSMLTARSPRLKGTNVIVFPLQNETQEVELLKEKSTLFNWLKRHLRNAKLQLEVEYIRENKRQQKAFTSADKYKALVEKNPLLDKLKDALNLDLE